MNEMNVCYHDSASIHTSRLNLLLDLTSVGHILPLLEQRQRRGGDWVFIIYYDSVLCCYYYKHEKLESKSNRLFYFPGGGGVPAFLGNLPLNMPTIARLMYSSSLHVQIIKLDPNHLQYTCLFPLSLSLSAPRAYSIDTSNPDEVHPSFLYGEFQL